MAYLGVKSYSTTAASNNSASPNGFPEGMAPSGVNDSARQLMAVVAEMYQTLPLACDFRLTLTSGTPVTTSDVTAAETVYWTPYKGNRVWLYDGSAQWNLFTTAELSIDVPDATQMQDVFVYDNSGTPTLELTAWTNETTRATALTLQNGVLVKTGATTRRYVGSFYSTTAGNGQTEDSFAKRYLWNYYNRVVRPLRVTEATNSWSYSTASYQQANASTANQLDFVIGVSEDCVHARVTGGATNSSATGRTVYIGIGLDSTTVNSGINGVNSVVTNSAQTVMHASYTGFPGVGRHYLAWLEHGAGADTQTWYGDNGGTVSQAGMTGELPA
jgi:hypothetical protein